MPSEIPRYERLDKEPFTNVASAVPIALAKLYVCPSIEMLKEVRPPPTPEVYAPVVTGPLTVRTPVPSSGPYKVSLSVKS